MKPALEALVGRRSFFKKAGMAAAGASALGFATAEDAEATLQNVNTSSSPSDLRITDLRVAQLVDAPMRVPAVRCEDKRRRLARFSRRATDSRGDGCQL